MAQRNSMLALGLALTLAAPGAGQANVAPRGAPAAGAVAAATVPAAPAVAPRLTLQTAEAGDQDDLAFWLHPGELGKSTVVSSDKVAGKLFVYDLDGKVVQTLAAQKPGNVDTRYGFRLGRDSVDIVAFNERDSEKIRVYKVNPGSRQLERIDDGGIASGPNYGFALYKSLATGRFYAFVSPKTGGAIKQFELVNSGRGSVTAVGPLRELRLAGTVEGMVADDESGRLFLAEENGGIWAFDAEPNRPAGGRKIAAAGEHGLLGDIEGLALYYLPGGEGYLIASNQGTSTFRIYGRQPPHAYLGGFTVGGVMQTDGLEVINLPLGAQFAQGLFASHNGRRGPYPIQLAKWDDIASVLGLRVDTRYWDPRREVLAGPAGPLLAAQAEPGGKAADPAGTGPAPARPTATAALLPAGKVDDDEGRFRVDAGCRDASGAVLASEARLNGVPVQHGQVVKLEFDKHPKVKTKHGTLEVQGRTFRLDVACRDAAGNVETAAATPRFAHHDG